MPSKIKTATKTVKSTAKKAAAKVRPAARKATAKVKATARPAAKKNSAKAKTGKKKAAGLMQSVKAGMQTGIDAVTGLVKRVAPDSLVSKPTKRRRK